MSVPVTGNQLRCQHFPYGKENVLTEALVALRQFISLEQTYFGFSLRFQLQIALAAFSRHWDRSISMPPVFSIKLETKHTHVTTSFDEIRGQIGGGGRHKEL